MNNKTIEATIAAAVVVVCNVGLYVFGVTIDADTLTTILGGIATLAVTILTAWHNFDFTKAAQQGTAYTHQIKYDAKLAEYEGTDD